jgi:hypothetical protein
MINVRETIKYVLDNMPAEKFIEDRNNNLLFVFGKKGNAITKVAASSSGITDDVMFDAGKAYSYLEPTCVALYYKVNAQMVDTGEQWEFLQVMADSEKGIDVEAVAILVTHVGDQIVLGETVWEPPILSELLDFFWDGVQEATEELSLPHTL